MHQAIRDSHNEEMSVGNDTRLLELKSQKTLIKLKINEKLKPISEMKLDEYISKDSDYHPLSLLQKTLVPFTDHPAGFKKRNLIQYLLEIGRASCRERV